MFDALLREWSEEHGVPFEEFDRPTDYRGRRLRVEVRQNEAEYELVAGDPLELLHHGETLTVQQGNRRSGRSRAPPTLRAPSARRSAHRPGGTREH